MRGATVTTISCPNCNNTIPGWATTCQFCGAPLSNYARPAGTAKPVNRDRKTWYEYAYYTVAVYWILNGAYEVAQGIGWVPNPFFELGKGSFVGILGAITMFLGVGLLLEQTWAQFLIKMLSWLMIAMCLVSLPWVMLGKNPAQLAIPILVQMAVCGFQVYLINKVGDA